MEQGEDLMSHERNRLRGLIQSIVKFADSTPDRNYDEEPPWGYWNMYEGEIKYMLNSYQKSIPAALKAAAASALEIMDIRRLIQKKNGGTQT